MLVASHPIDSVPGRQVAPPRTSGRSLHALKAWRHRKCTDAVAALAKAFQFDAPAPDVGAAGTAAALLAPACQSKGSDPENKGLLSQKEGCESEGSDPELAVLRAVSEEQNSQDSDPENTVRQAPSEEHVSSEDSDSDSAVRIAPQGACCDARREG